jgi:hypothetical protein
MAKYEHLFWATCPQCSHEIDDEAFTCINCGRGQIWATFPHIDGGTYIFGCHDCGDMYSSVGLFCPRCGARIPLDFVRRKDGHRNFLRALGTGGLVVLVMLVVLLLVLWWAAMRGGVL